MSKIDAVNNSVEEIILLNRNTGPPESPNRIRRSMPDITFSETDSHDCSALPDHKNLLDDRKLTFLTIEMAFLTTFQSEVKWSNDIRLKWKGTSCPHGIFSNCFLIFTV